MSKKSFFVIILTFLVHPYCASAGIDVPWSTTYNCTDWLKYSDTLNCDGISKEGSWTSQPEGYYEQITAAANNPSGAGGKGQRHWIGDGTNNGSGGIKINFNTPQTKIWFRWYQRWEAGFSSNWDTFKNVWFQGDGGSRNVFHTGRPNIGGIDLDPPDSTTGVQNVAYGSSFYSSGTSDGTWQCFEVHLDIPNATWKAWINGVLVAENNNVNFASTNSIVHILLPVNVKNVSNGRSMYLDFDDLAISNTGYIGPLTGGGGVDLSAPSVSISSPAQGQTISGNVTVSANASDNVGVSGIQYKLNGANFGPEDTIAPFSTNIDTTTLSDGSYTLTALARDAAGNQTTSSPVTVTVNNASGTQPNTTLLLSESFEDSNFSTRGWYDNTAGQILDATEYAPVNGSTKSVKYHFAQNASTPDSGGTVRHKFTATDDFYAEYWVKYSAGYQGSGSSSHPHELFFMSDQDADYNSPNHSFLNVKIEQNALRPRVIFRDDKQISTSYGTPPIDLASTTETRAAHGCNGEQDGYPTDCYQSDTWYNGKHFTYDSAVISDNTWHKVKVHIKLNTVSGSTTNADGVMQYWLNDVLVFDYKDLVIRTSSSPNIKFNQLGIAPYIGVGSPISQTMWIDELKVYTSPSVQLSPPASFQRIN